MLLEVGRLFCGSISLPIDRSEIAISYLLAWHPPLDAQDEQGLTPLHLAVKSAGSLKTSRPVRLLLIRGARRDVRDNHGRKPIDLVEEIDFPLLAAELRDMLVSLASPLKI